LLSLEEIEEDDLVVGEVSFGKSQADTHGVHRGAGTVGNEGWHLCGVLQTSRHKSEVICRSTFMCAILLLKTNLYPLMY